VRYKNRYAKFSSAVRKYVWNSSNATRRPYHASVCPFFLLPIWIHVRCRADRIARHLSERVRENDMFAGDWRDKVKGCFLGRIRPRWVYCNNSCHRATADCTRNNRHTLFPYSFPQQHNLVLCRELSQVDLACSVCLSVLPVGGSTVESNSGPN
jgi:hypothetical protein